LAISRILSSPDKPGKDSHLSIPSENGIPLAGMRLTRDHQTGRPIPYSVLHQIGFTVPRRLPFGRWALTPPFHPYPALRAGRFVFCGTFRHHGLTPAVPPLSRGISPCGVRTFLYPDASGQREPANRLKNKSRIIAHHKGPGQSHFMLHSPDPAAGSLKSLHQFLHRKQIGSPVDST